MWRADGGSYSPDASHMAYVPNSKWQAAWKRYRGGQTTPIYIVSLRDLQLVKIPRENSNDANPVWFGDPIYFLPDRNGPVSLFAYDTKTKAVKQVIENKGLDLKSVSAGPDALVYEQFGGLYLLDPKSGSAKHIDVRVNGDLPATRAHWMKAADKILNAGISPTGQRAVFEARGEILTVPAEKGNIRNLTRTTTAAERDPAWSPDGKWIAFFSDESGEYALHLVNQSGLGDVKKIGLGNPPSYFYSPTWSPDSKKVAFTDKRLNLWYVDIDKGGSPKKVDTDLYEDPTYALDPAWSPDSKWLTYSRFLPSHFRAVFVYALESGQVSQVTDGLSDVRFPVFDKNGKYIYFGASTDFGLSAGWLDLTSYQHPVSRNVYAVVLKKGEPSPAEPESDDEKIGPAKPDEKSKDADKDKDSGKGKEADKKSEKKEVKKDENKDEKKDEKKEEPVKVTIDLEGIGQRIVSLPVKAANYEGLTPGKAGVLYLTEEPLISPPGPPHLTVSNFALPTRKTEPFLNGVSGYTIFANGEKVLYRQGPAGGFIAAK